MPESPTDQSHPLDSDRLEVAARRLRIVEQCGLFYIENCSSGVLIAEKGIILYANKRASAITGYHHSEIEGQPIELLVPEAKRPVHTNHVTGYSRDPRPRPMKGFELQRKDGTLSAVEIELLTNTEVEGAYTIVTLRVTG